MYIQQVAWLPNKSLRWLYSNFWLFCSFSKITLLMMSFFSSVSLIRFQSHKKRDKMSLQLSYGRTLVPLPLPPAFVPSKREEGCCSKSPRQRQLPNKGESNKFLGSLVTIKKFLWPRHYSSILNYLKTWPHWAVVVEQWKLERKAAAAEKTCWLLINACDTTNSMSSQASKPAALSSCHDAQNNNTL